MGRTRIPLSDCGLLSRRNARRYCGCLGEERFDREVGPHVTARLLGSERFYSRKELDAWIDGPTRPSDWPTPAELLEKLERSLESGAQRQRRLRKP
jgi:hypothetical protein